MATLQASYRLREAEMDTLQTKVQALEASCKRYYDIRERFLEVYKRSQTPSSADYKTIRSGNQVAYGGDCAVDALLYTTGRRKDLSTFKEIYFLSPLEIMQIRRLLLPHLQSKLITYSRCTQRHNSPLRHK